MLARVELVPTGVFSAKLLSSQSACSLSWLFPSRRREGICPFFNFLIFLLAHFSCQKGIISGVSTNPPSPVRSTNLLKVHSVPLSRPLPKTINTWCDPSHSFSDWLPAGLGAADNSLLNQVVQPVFRLPHCPFI